jgi:choice-of-anchor A domain-containing protein
MWSPAVQKSFKLTLALMVVLSGAAQAGNISLGQAAEFNTFLKGSLTSPGPDVEGRAAIGGDLVITGAYTFADKNASAKGAEVIVGGNVTAANGAIKVHGGTEFSQGQLVYGGTISGTLGSGTATKTSNSGIDFNAAFTQLTKLSEQLSKSTTPTVIDRNKQDNVITFTPSASNPSNVYVIDINQQDLSFGLLKIDNKNIAKDALIVFNVKNPTNATSVDFKIGQMDLGKDISTSKFINGANQSAIDKHILFNFYGVTDLQLSSGIYGSILAPTANITSSSGVVWGHVIANSWKGNMQMNWAPLNVPAGTPPPAVSAPSPIALLLLVPALFWFRRRTAARQQQVALAV